MTAVRSLELNGGALFPDGGIPLTRVGDLRYCSLRGSVDGRRG